MKIRALESFSGALTMYKGEVIDYDNKPVVDDLLRCKYVEEVKKDDTPATKAKRSVRKNDSKSSN